MRIQRPLLPRLAPGAPPRHLLSSKWMIIAKGNIHKHSTNTNKQGAPRSLCESPDRDQPPYNSLYAPHSPFELNGQWFQTTTSRIATGFVRRVHKQRATPSSHSHSAPTRTVNDPDSEHPLQGLAMQGNSHSDSASSAERNFCKIRHSPQPLPFLGLLANF
ncbi:hypothetical protein LR48_Vigan05g148700 [Vigna angularis]|uniref:Uncharacterized protein n=1 Tax=Phaseolus angularis TaxID=3914 RepID=A0A0L9UMS8_PHAAN|nr:hypothetical protein LR48_Vigan05g148700 [Vigna angularis]